MHPLRYIEFVIDIRCHGELHNFRYMWEQIAWMDVHCSLLQDGISIAYIFVTLTLLPTGTVSTPTLPHGFQSVLRRSSSLPRSHQPQAKLRSVLGLGRIVSKRHLWLTRCTYIGSSKIPYIVPNRSMVVALFELVASILFVTHICLDYLVTDHPQVTVNKIVFWNTIGGLPSWLSIWLTGWSLLYMCQGPQHGSSKPNRRFPPPWAYNLAWISGWFLAFVWVAFNCNNISATTGQVDLEMRNLTQIMIREHGLPVNSPEHRKLALENKAELQHFSDYLARNRALSLRWVASWIALGIVLVLFYIFILKLLVQKIREVLRQCEAEQFTFLNEKCDEALQAEKQLIVEKSLAPLHALRQELRLLRLFSFSIMTVLLAEVFVRACQYWTITQDHSSEFFIKFSLVSVMIPSVFMSPVLLLQCWKGFTSHAPIRVSQVGSDNQQRDVRQSMEMGSMIKPGWSTLADNAGNTSQNSTNFQLPAFYQKLFWWYDNPDADERDCLHIETYYPPVRAQLSTASLASEDQVEVKSMKLSRIPDAHHK
ncbi:hypothetical protein Pst134EA_023218 [Puccinia striiformis f. sp. tritici]|uniref:hypothetical protein n=1 Tax=Puccinia striiformis f. sp. tritici TaxID=168172 RepID=UPI002007606B|nr:hypothetical protein Pst134EA_023218 [Puccinia striiformis f. sp. tritici]KAH9446220.1 hypothetical protein Pst134EB_024038 [Puccinia striiformis f. sp. tritici]KAH9455768.1 hypothetical protein Pst134EA_023218 [Puccinia striiformis f. sp. tritici]